MFGYGSLMYPNGINGRGLKHKYTWGDLSTATLIGYKRGMFAEYSGWRYYGIMKANKSTVKGVLIPIFSDLDLEALLINEGAHDIYKDTLRGKMYEAVDVTKTICRFSHLIPATTPIYTLVSEVDKSKQGNITPWYVANVWAGVSRSPWEKVFVRSLQRTGLIKPSKWQKKMACLYNAAKLIRRTVRR
jgi:hypothetical protein